MDKYILERDGQLDFYKVFLPRVNPALDIDEILADNNDGVINGNLLEFKLHVTDLNAVLFQCIKYLSALRVKGKPVPANILIIDVNAATLWLYRSAPYLSDIESCISAAHQRTIVDLSVATLKQCCTLINRLTWKALLPCSKNATIQRYTLMKIALLGGLCPFTKQYQWRGKKISLVMIQASTKQSGKLENPFILNGTFTLIPGKQMSNLII